MRLPPAGWVASALCTLLGASILALTMLLTRGVTYGTSFEPVPNLPSNRYVVNVELDKIVRDQDLQRSVDMIATGGFGWVRQAFAWNEIKITGNGGLMQPKTTKITWDQYERIVN